MTGSGFGRAAALMVSIAAVASARADDVALPRTKTILHLGTGWHEVKAPGLVAAYRTDRGALLAITRADVPNPDAWKAATRPAYADRVARGLESALTGAKRRSKKLTEAGGIPALDVEAARGDTTLIVRVLLFRTYGLSLAIEVPPGADVAAARAIAATFAPP